jgi:hypothetical protein
MLRTVTKCTTNTSTNDNSFVTINDMTNQPKTQKQEYA